MVVLGQPIAGRECGPCHACCQDLAVKKIPGRFTVKPRGVMCQHASDAGCAVYARRPPGCRAWFCGWMLDEVMADDERPDLAGYIVVTTTHPISISLLREDAADGAHREALRLARLHGAPVHVVAAWYGYDKPTMPIAEVRA